MMKILRLLTCLFSMSLFSQVVDIPVGGENLMLYEKLQYMKFQKDHGFISVEEKHADESLVMKFTTTSQPEFIHDLSAKLQTTPVFGLNKGRVFLLTFDAITTKSSLETGEAKLNCVIKQSNDFNDNLMKTMSISSQWQTYYIPFELTKIPDMTSFGLVFQFGFKPQEFLVKNLKLINFPSTVKYTDLPITKITYQGMENNAKWRQDAKARIEKIRKGNVEVVFEMNGKPLQNTQVNIALTKHDFRFGAAITAEEVTTKQSLYNFFKKNFNTAVLENDLKMKSWRWQKNIDKTISALDILKNDGVNVKGHVLVWPGFQYMTPDVEENKNTPKYVESLVKSHVDKVLNATNGKVDYWDCLNEAYTNKDLEQIMGNDDLLYYGFTQAYAKNPKMKRLVNEYGIISKGGLDTKKQDWYYELAKRIDLKTEGLLDGIGFQCHIGTDLTPPERVLSILDRFATLNKDLGISEFTMEVDDNELRYKYTRDFMIAAFSHPSIKEFMFWGFHSEKNNKAAFISNDGRLTAMGSAYFDLVGREWKTVENFKTDPLGKHHFRGFYGVYEYKLFVGEVLHTGIFEVKKDSPNKIIIKL